MNNQIQRVNDIIMNYELFHPAEPNNFVLLLINKRYDKSDYLQKISTLTEPLNKINFILLKLCKQLMGNLVSEDLKYWALNIKQKTNLKSIPYVLNVIKDLENRIIKKSFSSYLAANHQGIIKECLQIPSDLLNIPRMNIYLLDSEVEQALIRFLIFLTSNVRLNNVIRRIEIAQEGLGLVDNKKYPKIILYFESEIYNISENELAETIKRLCDCFFLYQSVQANLEFSWPIAKHITLTHGYRLYKILIQALGLLDKIYASESNYAFTHTNSEKWRSRNSIHHSFHSKV